ncbi:BREX-1 system adenine-specific DNA-methyltransferase PglX [Actinomyces procaprae]|uniref:BREX-1 system adenine-specific DNA-methyltransferase PglX n=1 Tax=Actinomyces procaprae TaxID=2560010 RepID=UPI001B3500FB|nr:BREX-1 system adenine-specific DNA-methyltransferase PglX [Actinomyces procaprae]
MTDTRALEVFATSARSQLMAEVEARLMAVLSATSTAREEFPGAVRALEERIRHHGGDAAGRRRVVEEQAYVWFNRIIALRFMDANGYTSPALVSPEGGVEVGQPAVLAAAKRGEFDSQVFTRPGSAERIADLLNGAITSPAPQEEAYGLILGAYCAYWNRTMPFMFAPDGDYTALLMPADMLADSSVRAQAVGALTVEACRDVEVIGWLYQFYIAERKAEVFAGFRKNQKAGATEIPAATQLFTPDWIVRYLVQNSVGRLWMLNHPDSHLIDQMDYYIEPADREHDFLRITEPEQLTVMDPCCGSGHMLTYAFDLLYAIYEEEGYAPSEIPSLILEHNLYGTEIDPRAAALAAFALMMKVRSRQRRFPRELVQPHIRVIEPVEFSAGELDQLAGPEGSDQAGRYFWQNFIHADVLGSLIVPDVAALPGAKERLASLSADTLDAADLHVRAERAVIQAEYLTRSYAVVATNPPYMGSSNMGSVLSTWVKKHHPQAKSDLFAAFIERCLGLAKADHGLVAMITMQAWMFLGSFEKLRRRILHDAPPVTMLHLGERAFDLIGGEVVSTTAFVLEPRRNTDESCQYFRVVPGGSEAEKEHLFRQALAGPTDLRFSARPQTLLTLPGGRIAYWLSPAMTRAFTTGKPLGEVAAPKQGLATADNARFLRQWFEVSHSRTCFDADSREAAAASGAKWFPHLKGGEFRKWWGNQDYVVNWEHDGAEIQDFRDANGKQKSRPQNIDSYFKPAISWSRLSSGDIGFRYSPRGFIENDKSPFIVSGSSNHTLLSVLNSSTTNYLMAALAPTIMFEIGQLSELPLLNNNLASDIQASSSTITRKLVEIARSDWNAYETSWDFRFNPLVRRARSGGSLADALERWWQDSLSVARDARELETENNRYWAEVYGLQDEVPIEVPLSRVSLTSNPYFRYAPNKGAMRTDEEYRRLFTADAVRDLISYGVGCLFGRYSLNTPGLVLADQGATVQEFLDVVLQPSFAPDEDGVIPVTSGEWFADDIVTRFRSFLVAAFGRDHLEANVRLIEGSLGKSLRQYFVKDFYKDHCRRYSNRPIYWMVSSRTDNKAAFQALIYLHRYTPDTLNTVLGDYLREFQAKLRSEIGHLERSKTAADQKRADAHRRALTECEDYERDVLFPLASRRPTIDLDDGILVNYLRFGAALQKIPAIENKRRDVQTWTWPTAPLAR